MCLRLKKLRSARLKRFELMEKMNEKTTGNEHIHKILENLIEYARKLLEIHKIFEHRKYLVGRQIALSVVKRRKSKFLWKSGYQL